jgi:hypothetical protein
VDSFVDRGEDEPPQRCSRTGVDLVGMHSHSVWGSLMSAVHDGAPMSASLTSLGSSRHPRPNGCQAVEGRQPWPEIVCR